METLKNLMELNVPDERNAGFVIRNVETDESRPLIVEYIYSIVQEIKKAVDLKIIKDSGFNHIPTPTDPEFVE